MHHFWIMVLSIFLLASCQPADEKTEANTASDPVHTISLTTSPTADNSVIKEEYHFEITTLKPECETDSAMVCALNLAIKCAINPHMETCRQHREAMPGFTFMEDESLQRPTQVSYKINKLKPLPGGLVEVYTSSQCNGNWFGLCNGNIIYVMQPNQDTWSVTEIYAMEN